MKLSLKEKAAFGLGAVGKDMVYALVSSFILYYYNTILGVSASFVGIILMIARVFDAFNDPIMGIIVAKTKSKFGKFRPWIFSGTILNAFILYAMFSVPYSFDGRTLLIYISVIYILWGITYTIMDIPYWSMIPAVTKSGKDRENLSVIARSMAGIGSALITIFTVKLVNILGGGGENADEREGYKWLALIIAVLFVLFTAFITCFCVKERQQVETKAATVEDMFKALIKNDQTMVVVVVIICINTAVYLTSNLLLYFFQFQMGDKDMYTTFAAFGGAVQILSMMAGYPMLRKKFSTKQLFRGAIILAIAGYMILLLLTVIGSYNLYILFIPAFCIFAEVGITTVLTTVFLSDTVDYGEWKNGQRNESVTFSMQTFVVKLASALAVFIAGVGLDIIKLDTKALVQSDSTLTGLKLLMTIIPIIGLVIAYIVFNKKYILDDNKMKEINQKNS